MPWTFAHPAAVLPFRRIGRLDLPFVGLVLGSLSPDFGYFTGQYSLATFAHSIPGILLYCLPVSMLLALVVIRFRSFLVAPLPHHAAIESATATRFWPLSNAAKLALAVIVGAMTHIIWDSFTHIHGRPVQYFAPMRKELFSIAGHSFPAYNILQHASTLIGISILVIAYRNWLRSALKENPRAEHSNWRSYILLAVIAVSSGTIGLSFAWVRHSTSGALSVVVVQGVIYSTVVFGLAYIVLAIFVRYRRTV